MTGTSARSRRRRHSSYPSIPGINTSRSTASGRRLMNFASAAGPSRGVLSLHPPGGRTLTIPLDQVAVIDFAGGKPGAAELDALDADSPHVLVLRNGNVRRGRLIGIVDGEFVRWEVEGGAQIEIALRNVSRIYLQLPRARAGKAGRRSGR